MLTAGELHLIFGSDAEADRLLALLRDQFGLSSGDSRPARFVTDSTIHVIPLEKSIDVAALRQNVLANAVGLSAWALRPATLSPVRLLVFDTDSTFIDQEVIDEIAGYAGYKSHVAAITERAMRGELDFNAALAERVHLLRGLPEHTLEAVLRTKLNLTNGARELIGDAHERTVATYLLSGGFTFFTGAFTQELGMTGHFANVLEIENGHLTGRTTGPIVNRQRKAELLREIAAKHGVALANTVAVGDGANDMDMLSLSGMGIAFCAKPALVGASAAAIFDRNLRLVSELIF